MTNDQETTGFDFWDWLLGGSKGSTGVKA